MAMQRRPYARSAVNEPREDRGDRPSSRGGGWRREDPRHGANQKNALQTIPRAAARREVDAAAFACIYREDLRR